jgi:ParB-like chromosome segregation protein Spo0J
VTADAADTPRPNTEPLAFEWVPLSQLREYHRNPRQGDVDTIKVSLRANGLYRPVVVNRGTYTGRPGEVLAGNHTMKAARDLGWETIAVTWGDWDDDQCKRIVLVDNQAADKGTYDDRERLALLEELDDLDGTGFDEADHDALARAVAADEGPGFGDAPVDELGQALLTVVVEVHDEDEQQTVLEHCLEQGWTASAVCR